MSVPAKEKIIVAIDSPDLKSALALISPLAGEGCVFKIGLQLFTAVGPSIIKEIQALGARVFLDLKFHDIPNTAKEAVKSAVALGVDMTTIHLAGGPAMVSESVAAAENSKTLVLGVTVLTSMDDETLDIVGIPRPATDQVLYLAEMGANCRLRGVVASPHEITPLREEFGHGLVIVTPGVRPAGSDKGDQRRVMTPGEAVRCGADYLVIGRPITAAASPHDAFLWIADEISEAT
ncbi:MAG: orotidine-5'-phosphate decarboxylase [Verrucomicrobia bacterium]|nr:orotidine-5'-phosphate decarboxylase [Verrucomicrobiota bacterium]